MNGSISCCRREKRFSKLPDYGWGVCTFQFTAITNPLQQAPATSVSPHKNHIKYLLQSTDTVKGQRKSGGLRKIKKNMPYLHYIE